jgi:hypothetical protein
MILVIGVEVLAQTPQSFRYQAVARDNSGNILASQPVSFKISILSGSVSGTAVYSETHHGLSTNAFGLVELEIGKGIPVAGTFSAIDWGSNIYFVKIEMDPAGGGTYQTLSTSQLLSVPYALYSQKAGNGFSGNYNDLTNKPLLFDGTWVSLTGKPTFATVATSGSYTDLLNKPVLFDGTWNSLTGKPTTLGGYGITNAMSTSHVANGITSILITNWNSAYSWGNHSGLYKPLSYLPSWSEITAIPAGFADGVDNVDDADNSTTNEIQLLSLSGNNLSLSKSGGTVSIPGDNWGTQTVVSNATLEGNGLAATPLKIAQQSAGSGQVLKWNGTTWLPANDETGSGSAIPTGPAGGDLTGSYPDPVIASGTITSAKILDGGIATADLADNSVTLEKIADNAVTVAKLPSGAALDNFLRGDGTWAIPAVGSVTEFDPTWDGPANLDGDIGRNGNVGIGTVSPTSLLHTRGTGTGGGNVLFEGEYKTYFPGAPPVEGAGTRMMWYPDQAVFRMGAVSDDRWDAANLGSFSTAIGYNCVASGSVSFSLGSYATAANTCAIAIGHGVQAWAYASTAMGYSTTAYGYASTAFGDNTVAQAYVSTAIGQYNVGSGTKNLWEETEPIFEIGIGRSHNARKNAMTVLKNGYVGIGTITPEAGLHVAGDGWPNSFAYLEAAAGSDAGIRFYESTTPKWHIFNDASVGGLMIQNNATTPAIYCNQSNAYVGIRTSSPTQALDVNGNARFQSIASTAYSRVLNIQSDGTLTTATSDGRLKENVRALQNSLDKVVQLRGVSFTWKNNPEYGTRIGFIAQEFENVIPELVFTNQVDGFKGINYAEVSAVLVEAIKELKAENERLKTENEQVKARLEKIEAILGGSVIK